MPHPTSRKGERVQRNLFPSTESDGNECGQRPCLDFAQAHSTGGSSPVNLSPIGRTTILQTLRAMQVHLGIDAAQVGVERDDIRSRLLTENFVVLGIKSDLDSWSRTRTLQRGHLTLGKGDRVFLLAHPEAFLCCPEPEAGSSHLEVSSFRSRQM
jgi:hypothetical protein